MRFIPSLLVAFVVGCLASCQQQTPPETNELALQPSPELELIGPEDGFEYPFVLRYPEPGSNVTPFLIVEPNNTGTVADDLNTHLESAMSLARGRPVGGFVSVIEIHPISAACSVSHLQMPCPRSKSRTVTRSPCCRRRSFRRILTRVSLDRIMSRIA